MTARTRFPGPHRLMQRAAAREGHADSPSFAGRIWDRLGLDLHGAGPLWGGSLASAGDFVYLTLPWDEIEQGAEPLAEQTAAQVVRRVAERRQRQVAASPAAVAARPLQRVARSVPVAATSHEGRLLSAIAQASPAPAVRRSSVDRGPLARVGASVDRLPAAARERAVRAAVRALPPSRRIAASADVAAAPRLGAAPIASAQARAEGLGRGDRSMRPLGSSSPSLVALEFEAQAPPVSAASASVAPSVAAPAAPRRVAAVARLARTQQQVSRAGPSFAASSDEAAAPLRPAANVSRAPAVVEPAVTSVQRPAATVRAARRALAVARAAVAPTFERGERAAHGAAASALADRVERRLGAVSVVGAPAARASLGSVARASVEMAVLAPGAAQLPSDPDAPAASSEPRSASAGARPAGAASASPGAASAGAASGAATAAARSAGAAASRRVQGAAGAPPLPADAASASLRQGVALSATARPAGARASAAARPSAAARRARAVATAPGGAVRSGWSALAARGLSVRSRGAAPAAGHVGQTLDPSLDATSPSSAPSGVTRPAERAALRAEPPVGASSTGSPRITPAVTRHVTRSSVLSMRAPVGEVIVVRAVASADADASPAHAPGLAAATNAALRGSGARADARRAAVDRARSASASRIERPTPAAASTRPGLGSTSARSAAARAGAASSRSAALPTSAVRAVFGASSSDSAPTAGGAPVGAARALAHRMSDRPGAARSPLATSPVASVPRRYAVRDAAHEAGADAPRRELGASRRGGPDGVAARRPGLLATAPFELLRPAPQAPADPSTDTAPTAVGRPAVSVTARSARAPGGAGSSRGTARTSALAAQPASLRAAERATPRRRPVASATPVASRGALGALGGPVSARPSAVSRASSRDALVVRADAAGRVRGEVGPRAYVGRPDSAATSAAAPWARAAAATERAASTRVAAFAPTWLDGAARASSAPEVGSVAPVAPAIERALSRGASAPKPSLTARDLRLAPATAAAFRAASPGPAQTFVVVRDSDVQAAGAQSSAPVARAAARGERIVRLDARGAGRLFAGATSYVAGAPAPARGPSRRADMATVLLESTATASGTDEVVVSRRDAGREIQGALRRMGSGRASAAAQLGGVAPVGTVLAPYSPGEPGPGVDVPAGGSAQARPSARLGAAARAAVRGEAALAGSAREGALEPGPGPRGDAAPDGRVRAPSRGPRASRLAASPARQLRTDAAFTILIPGQIGDADSAPTDGGPRGAAARSADRLDARASAVGGSRRRPFTGAAESDSGSSVSGAADRARARRAALVRSAPAAVALDGSSGTPPEAGVEGPAWAERERRRGFVSPREGNVAERASLRSTSTLVNAIARAESPDELVRIISGSRMTPEQLRRELPGPAFKLVQRVEQMHTIAKQARRTEDGERSFARSRRGRSLPEGAQPVSLSSTRFIPVATGLTSELSSSASRVTQLANKLLNLIHLAEVDQRVQDARQQVRMSDSEPGAGAGSASSSSDVQSPNINALKRDVFEAVLRKLNELQSRSVEDPNGHAMWW